MMSENEVTWVVVGIFLAVIDITLNKLIDSEVKENFSIVYVLPR